MAVAALESMGLASALGMDVPSCARGLAGRARPTVPVRLEGFESEIRMPYYRILDGAPLFEPSRLSQLIGRVTREALGAASVDASELGRMPLFVGSTSFAANAAEAEYQASLLADPRAVASPPQAGLDDLVDALRDELGCGGESFTFNTACTAAANAALTASRYLASGRSRHALVLGVELANVTTLTGFSALQLLGSEVRPFDARRDGMVLGEAVAVLLLSQPARTDRFRLVGGASNCDSYGLTTANPDGGPIAAVQDAALRDAGVVPEQVRGIKAHGTATPANDLSEAAGIRRSFARPPPVCGLKPYVGHTLGACGVTELILLVCALKEGYFPATTGRHQQDPALGLGVLDVPGPAPDGYYLLNAFGFGGNNTSLVVEKCT